MSNPDQSKTLLIVEIVLAVIGATTLLGAAGMAVMHGSLMGGSVLAGRGC